MTSTLSVHPGHYAICRLAPEAEVPAWGAGGDGFTSVTRTAAELSIVCPAGRVPEGVRREAGWRLLEVHGPLDFALTGVLAGLTASLAEAGVSTFAVSTFDTDYLLVREAMIGQAVAALRAAGHRVLG